MNMVMQHEFEHAYVFKQQQRIAIEREMEMIANFQAKHAKHNVYLTKAQKLRNEVTKQHLDSTKMYDAEDKYLTEAGKPKRLPTNQLLKQIGLSEASAAPKEMSN
jgi:GTP-binding protein EngB required for normal cell division